ncbi:DUF4426 domain-containing protein [Algiphilus aromaticivorans]|uniref:DUF4426 domain-containing protein n=1 Tax=Algiphilus aromaticivorans TaxID=382454 RepID=UPI0005C17CB5|nr:DUF4426 domain-containing protein [Algiphilus aromaticivorans]
MSITLRSTALLLFAILALPAVAEQGGQSVLADGYEIHYAAINTTDVPPVTARALDIRRSDARALLVLNAQRVSDGSSLRTTAEGEVRNLTGQEKAFAPRAVEDGGVWYVLAEFRIANGERLRFDLQVLPEGAGRAIPLRFEQTFYRTD